MARAVLICGARAALGALCVLVPACLPSFNGTHYLCNLDPSCPPGFACVGGTCTQDRVPFDMAEFAGGPFTMGCAGDPLECPDDTQPAHGVMLSDFALDLSEVSQAAYDDCVQRTVCHAPVLGFTPDATPDLPVHDLTWDEASAYCQYRKRRLPTEAEWERAARGSPSASFPFPWGDTTVDCDHAIYAGCPPGGPVEATQRRPGDTPQGLHHMAGNVREWVADCYAKDYYTTLVGQSATQSVSNPTGPSCPQGSPHVLRGGGFGSEPDALVVWHRETDGALPDAPADAGVRCAISLMP